MKLLFSVLIVILVLTLSLAAAIINVPADQPTIQAGVDAAAVHDTVAIGQGTYRGAGNRDIEFRGKNLFVTAASGPGTVVIDCEGSVSEPHRGFYLHNGEDTSSVIDGLTIRGASWTWTSWQNMGGAIDFLNASATISRCTIVDNACNGILAQGAYPIRVQDCRVANNAATGVWLYYCEGVVSNTELLHNDSAGMWAYGSRPITVDSCVVAYNKGDGLNIVIAFGPFYVYRSTIVGNQTGLWFDGNPPKAQPGETGDYPDTSIIANTIVAFNKQGIRQGWYGLDHRVVCTDAYGNPDGDWFGSVYYDGDAYGNFSADPFFCDAAGDDFHVWLFSPVIPPSSGCTDLIGRYGGACPCCRGTVGNADGDALDLTDISDMSALVDHLFFGGSISACLDETDVDVSGSMDISDLQALIDFLFFGAALSNCP